MKYVQLLLGLILAFGAYADGKVEIKSVTAQQRYPWNGLVDIVVTMEGSADDIANAGCFFAATNSATGSSVTVTSISQRGSDIGSDANWTRQFIWNATNDVGAMKIDDLALTVGAKVQGGVQLWENGPYWAECNVGAAMPEEYGYYFWWGDTVGYKRNASNDGWESVKDGASFSFDTSNCRRTYGKDNSTLQSAGYIDSSGNLVTAHDAATVHLGVPWRMPTDAEFSTLINNCDTSWTTRGGMSGLLVTGRGAYASKSIFLPVAGSGLGSGLNYIGSGGGYWSSTPLSDSSYSAWLLGFDSGGFWRDYCPRYYGKSVRPVREFGDVGVGTANAGATVNAGVTTNLKLDCRTAVREPASEGEPLRYDAGWYEGGSEVRITDNATVVATGTVGSYTWRPETDATAPHLLKMEVLSEGQVIAAETAQFALGYIRNVTVRQLWPHNKVALEFTVAGDIGEVKSENEDLSVWCAKGFDTNVATRIYGDRSAKPGVHRIIWDVEEDGLILANVEAAFGVSVEDVIPLGGVQLWEDGPYWAECNVGASKPEEYGYYFWWGGTVGYERNAANNGWVSVKDGTSFLFVSGNYPTYKNCPTFGKSNSGLQSAGYIDSTGKLVAAYDVATVRLGAPWRMPTDAEFAALINNCDTQWTMRGGVCGRLITGRGAYASKSIFLPAAGCGIDYSFYNPGSVGYYWSSTPQSSNPDYALGLIFSSNSFMQNSNYWCRYYGHSVRPLRDLAK